MTLTRPSTHEALNAACRLSFEAFASRAFRIVEPGSPFEWNWHVNCISEYLESMCRGEIKRLIINLPPRCLKSYLVAQAFPAWRLGKNPSEKIISVSYGAELAKANAQKCRYIVQDEWYKQCFPKTVLSHDQNQVFSFETTQRGQYYTAGILGALTGKGADWILIDDALKPDEAISETVRNNTNSAIRSTLFSRWNDPRSGKLVMIMQRLHEDDPTGNLLADGGYTHLKLPAEAIGRSYSYAVNNRSWQMSEGELLFPARLTEEFLDQKRIDLGEIQYAGQYLQEPVPIGGGEFQDNWIQYYDETAISPSTMNVYILCDPAGGDEDSKKRKKKNSDWTAFAVVGLAPDNNYYLLDMVRDRLNPTERIDMLFLLHRKWNQRCGKPPRVGYEKYGMMTDTHYIKEKMRLDGYNFSITELGGTMAKNDRIRQLIPDMQMSRWYFPPTLIYYDSDDRKFDLVKEIIGSEMASFPRSKHDDCVDALSRIYAGELMAVFPKISGMVKKSKSAPQDWKSF